VKLKNNFINYLKYKIVIKGYELNVMEILNGKHEI